MKKLMIFCLLLALALPIAAVEDDQVMYAGGTAPALRVGVVGRLDTTSEKSLTFESSGTKLLIPYADIQSFEYSTRLGSGSSRCAATDTTSAFLIAALTTCRRLPSSKFRNTCRARFGLFSMLAPHRSASHAPSAPVGTDESVGHVLAQVQSGPFVNMTLAKVSQTSTFLPVADASIRS